MSDSAKQTPQSTDEVDVAFIGAGIMSATLAAMLKQLEPGWSQMIIERLDAPARESSSPWNNAGTGHSALCELNYTPETKGRIDIAKAVAINEKFQVSRQFWTHQLEHGILNDPRGFINSVPHVSFAHGDEQVTYLYHRYKALREHPLFAGLEYSDDEDLFAEKLPLMAEGRDFSHEKIAISWTAAGTDINYGALTKQFIDGLVAAGSEVRYGHEVQDLTQVDDKWRIMMKNIHTKEVQVVRANFVFVGAGGRALPLLQKSGIPEIRGWGGFPVSGQWLRCTNPQLIERHAAKVYGKASVGAPPMSVPHLDTRIINGKRGLLFGPYAGWTPKFLKQGSNLDLLRSIKITNLFSYLGVSVQEMGLTKYLITELLKDQNARMHSLREYMPTARDEDWELVTAGQRVQAIQPVIGPSFSKLAFGTSLINNSEGSIAGILGASPGASIAPAAMLEVLERCFGQRMIDWGSKIKEMVPSYGIKLAAHPDLFAETWEHTQKVLRLGD